jgi:hypothetical protein
MLRRAPERARGAGLLLVYPAMKHTLSILFIGTALTLAACGKDKKPATNEPAAAAPAAEPAKPDPNAAAAPAAPAGDPAKPEEKKAGGW